MADSLWLSVQHKSRKVTGGRMVSPEMKEGSCLHCSRKMSRDLIENILLKSKAVAIKPVSFNTPS